jgi:hypothetical protein
MVGLSCHNPLEVEYAEEKGWDLDYYMTSLYYMVRPRAEFEKLLGGHAPLGEIYLPSDPPRMMETIRKARKPCLAYKVLAAGRTVDSPQQVKERMAAALNGIKPHYAADHTYDFGENIARSWEGGNTRRSSAGPPLLQRSPMRKAGLRLLDNYMSLAILHSDSPRGAASTQKRGGTYEKFRKSTERPATGRNRGNRFHCFSRRAASHHMRDGQPPERADGSV